jgi:hypothetical protein
MYPSFVLANKHVHVTYINVLGCLLDKAAEETDYSNQTFKSATHRNIS